MFHEDTGLHERGHMSGYPENRGLGLTSSRFEPRREIQDLSRLVYNWKISFSGRSGASAEDFLIRLEECREFTPISAVVPDKEKQVAEVVRIPGRLQAKIWRQRLRVTRSGTNSQSITRPTREGGRLLNPIGRTDRDAEARRTPGRAIGLGLSGVEAGISEGIAED